MLDPTGSERGAIVQYRIHHVQGSLGSFTRFHSGFTRTQISRIPFGRIVDDDDPNPYLTQLSRHLFNTSAFPASYSRHRNEPQPHIILLILSWLPR